MKNMESLTVEEYLERKYDRDYKYFHAGYHIYHERYGRCTIIAMIQDTAFVQLDEPNKGKFLVVFGFAPNLGKWEEAYIFHDYTSALAEFAETIHDFLR